MPTPDRKLIAPGDWVSFQQQSRVVLGRVLYVRPCDRYPGWDGAECITDIGSVREADVLEVRRANA